MRRLSQKSGSSLRIALIFVCSIALLLIGGIFLKLFLVFRASSFDSTHQYIVEVDESREKGVLLGFNPANKSVVILTVLGKVDTTYGAYLGIPVDGVVHMSLAVAPTKLVENMLLQAKFEKGITIIDKIRLLFFVNSLKSNDFHQQTISLPIDATISEKLLPSLFLDNALYFDNESVAVINATGESGIGSQVAHMLTTIGVNVISVTTAEQEKEETSLSAFHPPSYTATRIAKFFKIDAIATQQSGANAISDITLIVGKKSLSQLQ